MFFRSNRALTALEINGGEQRTRRWIFRHWTVADPDGICTRMPLRALVFRRVRLRSIRVLTASKINSGEKQTRVIPETSATALAHTFDDSGPLEPFRCGAFAARQRSFSHPFFRRERGYHGGGSNLIFTARKESQEKTEQSV